MAEGMFKLQGIAALLMHGEFGEAGTHNAVNLGVNAMHGSSGNIYQEYWEDLSLNKMFVFYWRHPICDREN